MKILWVIYPFCAIFVMVGAAIAFTSIRAIAKSREIQAWPAVEARLLECDFKTHVVRDRHTYEVVVAYEYFVLGRVFQSNQIHPNYGRSNSEFHGPLYHRLKAASRVKVRYNVANPAESYIVPGMMTSAFASVFAGLLFFIAGLLFSLGFHFAIAGTTDFAARVDVVE
jgi:hypothetical protein